MPDFEHLKISWLAERLEILSEICLAKLLRTLFARNGVPETLVSDNVWEFHDNDLCTWLGKIRCKPMKMPTYHSESNGIAERMVASVKFQY